MKIALVHDYLNQWGGAENVLEVFSKVFPDAPIYTSISDPHLVKKHFADKTVISSYMQNLPAIKTQYKKYFPLYPFAFESFRLKGFDVILSMSSGFAKGVSFSPETLHINYCLTPMRFAWRYNEYIEKENIGLMYKPFLKLIIQILKKWDLKKNKKVDHFITLSEAVKQRIKDCYNREADIIYPPVNTEAFIPKSDSIPGGDYFLIVSRLKGYKRIDIAVQACSDLGYKLKVIGEGEVKGELEKMAGPTVEFLGRLKTEEVITHMQRCKAFIFPGEEDFGIAPLEAQAAGKPVIAYKAGGALDTIIDKKTGLYFEESTVESLEETLRKFDQNNFESEKCRKNANRFSESCFTQQIEEYVNTKYTHFKLIQGTNEQKN